MPRNYCGRPECSCDDIEAETCIYLHPRGTLTVTANSADMPREQVERFLDDLAKLLERLDVYTTPDYKTLTLDVDGSTWFQTTL
jgi:hypothetical protein